MSIHFRVLHDTASIYGSIWATPLAMSDTLTTGSLSIKEGAIDDIYPKMIEEEDISVKYNYDVEVSTFEM